MAIKLREYQQRAVDTVAPLIGSQEKILISMAPGTSKLLTMSHILYQYLKTEGRIYDEKILFIVNTETLASQAFDTLTRTFGDDKAITKELTSIRSSTVLVTTLEELHQFSYPQRFEEGLFQVIVFYNCETIGMGNTDVRNIIKFFVPYSTVGIDSVVANSSLYLGDPVYVYTLHDAVQDKVLVNISYTQISSYLKLSENKEFIDRISSFTKESIDTLLIDKQHYIPLADSILELTNNKKTLVICSHEDVATQLSFAINSIEDKYSISWSPSSDVRTYKLVSFEEEGKPFILTTTLNSLQGIELPITENIIFLCKIKDKSTFYALTSRFLKPVSGKRILNILDYFGNQEVVNQFLEEYNIGIKQKTEESEPIQNSSTPEHLFTSTCIIARDKKDIEAVMGVKDLAAELSDIISRLSYEQGRMIGIFGEWGRGKTFLINETWKILKNNPNIHRIDFQAWKYQETPATWAYLYEQFADDYYKSAKCGLQRFWRRIRLNLMRLGWKELLWFVLSLAITLVIRFFIPFDAKFDLFLKIISTFSITFIINLIIIYFSYRYSARELFKKYYTRPSFTHLLGIQAEIQKELKQLLAVWTKQEPDAKFMLFVDDIDRCPEDRIIQIIDSLRVMVDDEELSKKLIIVAAIDQRILKKAITYKYATTRKQEKDHIDTSEYIDKLFMISIKLGDLTPGESDEYFTTLSKADLRAASAGQTRQESETGTGQTQPGNTENETVADISAPREAGDEETEEDQTTIQTNTNTPAPVAPAESRDAFGITREESELLKQKIILFQKISPRQIRIFYFRYLIAKNLLIRQYNKINRKNIWITSAYSGHFIELLINLSTHEGCEIISKEKKAVITATDEKHKTDLLRIEVDRLDYEILICIMDIVIGY